MTVSIEFHVEKLLLCFCQRIIGHQHKQHNRQVGKLVSVVVKEDDPNYCAFQTVFKFTKFTFKFLYKLKSKYWNSLLNRNTS